MLTVASRTPRRRSAARRTPTRRSVGVLVASLLLVALAVPAASAQTVYPPPPPPDAEPPTLVRPLPRPPAAGEEPPAEEPPTEEPGPEVDLDRGPDLVVPGPIASGEAVVFVDGDPVPVEVIRGPTAGEFLGGTCRLASVVSFTPDRTAVLGLIAGPDGGDLAVPLADLFLVSGLTEECFAFVAVALDPDGAPVPLGDDGSLQVVVGVPFVVLVDGALPGGLGRFALEVEGERPQDLGTLRAGDDGVLRAELVLPPGTPGGVHALEVATFLPDGTALNGVIGITVFAPAGAEVPPGPEPLLPWWAWLLAFLVAFLLLWLLLARRRRRSSTSDVAARRAAAANLATHDPTAGGAARDGEDGEQGRGGAGTDWST